MNAFQRFVLWLAYALAFSVSMGWFALTNQLCSGPGSPDPAAQLTVPYNCHGRTTYLTPTQDDLRYWLPSVGVVLVGVIYALQRRRES